MERRSSVPLWAIACLALLPNICRSADQPAVSDGYAPHRQDIQSRDARKRAVPVIPPPEKKLRVIIDTDTGNEIDDIWAIALAIRSPQR
ncbi:MAG TPA: hypothetical protein VHS31_17430, partial [Tepidisphaeraceae bacterium]|nr:hypothetical protein [Tepidisphaeraceae bacterium]